MSFALAYLTFPVYLVYIALSGDQVHPSHQNNMLVLFIFCIVIATLIAILPPQLSGESRNRKKYNLIIAVLYATACVSNMLSFVMIGGLQGFYIYKDPPVILAVIAVYGLYENRKEQL